MSLDTLKQEFKNHLFNVDDLTGKQVAKVADVICGIEYHPDKTFHEALAIVENPTKEEISPEELEKAAECVLKAQAELEADTATGNVSQVFAESYYHGDDVDKENGMGLTADQWKAAKFSRTEQGPEETSKRTRKFYDGVLWYTRARLFSVRASRILVLFNLPGLVDETVDTGKEFWNVTLNAVTNHLSTITAIAGFSYFVEFFFDLSIMLRAAFWPSEEEEEQNPSGVRRFINTYNKDGRARRMRNSGVWALGNLAAFLINTYVRDAAVALASAAGVNLFLFAFDVGHDIWEYYVQQRKYKIPLQKVEKEIRELKDYILSNEAQHDPEKLKKAKLDLAAKECQKANLLKAKEADHQLRRRLLIITSIIFVGMVLVCLPQIAPAAFFSILAVKATGASTAMLGSVVGGFGRAMYELIKRKLSKCCKRPELEKRIDIDSTPHICKLLSPKSSRENKFAPEDKRNPLKRSPEEAGLTTPEAVSKAARDGLAKYRFQKQVFSASAPNFRDKEKKPLLKRNKSAPTTLHRGTMPWTLAASIQDGDFKFIDGTGRRSTLSHSRKRS